MAEHKGGSSKGGDGTKLIATNPNARSNYFIEDVYEAGIMLTGTEVKSLRQVSPNLRDAYIEISGAKTGRIEAWLVNGHIAPYTHGNIWNHDPARRRKLLLHANELKQLNEAITQKGMSLIPTRLYFKKGRAKIEFGVGKGKKKHDKRDDLKKRSAEREMDQARKKDR